MERQTALEQAASNKIRGINPNTEIFITIYMDEMLLLEEMCHQVFFFMQLSAGFS